MIGADFVAGRIAKIGGICSREMIARSRRAFVGAAIRDATGMKSIDLGLRGSSETNGGDVARRRFAIAWAGDDEGGLVAAIEDPAISERTEILDTERHNRHVVKLSRDRRVRGADKELSNTIIY